MYRQVLLVEVTPMAVFTAVEIFVGVRVPVLQVFTPMVKAPLTALALEAVVLCVSTTMALQVGFLVGTIVAEFASEHFQPRVNQLVTSYVHRAAESLVALVAAEGTLNVVQVLQMFYELPRVPEASAAFDALMHSARRLASPLSETRTKGCSEISGQAFAGRGVAQSIATLMIVMFHNLSISVYNVIYSRAMYHVQV